MEFYQLAPRREALPNGRTPALQGGLPFSLSKGFNTTIQFNWDWDNAPDQGKKTRTKDIFSPSVTVGSS